jgi:hypothetical protein
LPTAFPLDGDLVRVFYSGRDESNRSSVGSFVLRLGEQPKVEHAPPEPVLTPGEVGAFDDAGIGVGSVVACEGGDRLYYMGWNIGGSTPWRNAIGVAFGDARTGRFERGYPGPIMDRSPIDAYSLSYPWVIRLGPDDWRMWYGTHLQWGAHEADMNHAIRSATSSDGLEWRRKRDACLPPQAPEIATVRPSVRLRADGEFDMAYAARPQEGPYGIGWATGADGDRWRRRDVPIAATEDWEAGAVTYPCVFEQSGRSWLLFNGQGYGATGVGLAVWEDG